MMAAGARQMRGRFLNARPLDLPTRTVVRYTRESRQAVAPTKGTGCLAQLVERRPYKA